MDGKTLQMGRTPQEGDILHIPVTNVDPEADTHEHYTIRWSNETWTWRADLNPSPPQQETT